MIQFQFDLNNISIRCAHNNLDRNEIQEIQARHEQYYHIHYLLLGECPDILAEIRDLGVIFVYHIDTVISKSYSILGFPYNSSNSSKIEFLQIKVGFDCNVPMSMICFLLNLIQLTSIKHIYQ